MLHWCFVSSIQFNQLTTNGIRVWNRTVVIGLNDWDTCKLGSIIDMHVLRWHAAHGFMQIVEKLGIFSRRKRKNPFLHPVVHGNILKQRWLFLTNCIWLYSQCRRACYRVSFSLRSLLAIPSSLSEPRSS